MKDLKTTITGAISAICAILAVFNIVVPQEVSGAAAVIAGFLAAFFAKDAQKEVK